MPVPPNAARKDSAPMLAGTRIAPLLRAVKRRLNTAPSPPSFDSHDRMVAKRREGRPLDSIPAPPLEFLPPDPIEEIIPACERVVAAFHATIATAPDCTPDGLWRGLAARYQGGLAEALFRRDARGVAEVLSGMFIGDVAHGIAMGRESYQAARHDPRPMARAWHDWATSLGLAAGVVPLPSPEQGGFEDPLDLDSVDVVRQAAAAFGCSSAPPQAGALFGVRVDGAVLSILSPLHLYTAHRIGTMLGPGGGDVAEIGGGVGLLAFHAREMGSSRRHWIYDLPLAGALQGYYLLRSARADEVRLFGEDPAGGAIFLRPGTDFASHPGPVDLVLNQDSMPEMGAATMEGYLRSIVRLAPRHFLSINQEARAVGQGRVFSAAAAIGGFRPVYRVPYWIRAGYVEELYAVVN